MQTEKNLASIVKKALSGLEKRDRIVVAKRFGLTDNKKTTLEGIGKELGLTRERVRQIQVATLEKVKMSGKGNSLLKKTADFVMRESGGQTTLEHAKNLIFPEGSEKLTNHLEFVLSINKQIGFIKGTGKIKNIFHIRQKKAEKIKEKIVSIVKILKKEKKPIRLQKLARLITGKKNAILSLALASREIAEAENGKIGLASSPLVRPRSARDMAYYIMKEKRAPMHFKEIAEEIKKKGFREKSPTAPTVHNELILDNRFVLIGRGIYALSEWGYTQGTVEEVIEKVLVENPKGLSRESIIEKVLKDRIVAKNTILMNLLLKKKFKKTDKGEYRLIKSK